MKAKVLSILPLPDFGQTSKPVFELALVQVGLSEPGFVTVQTGIFSSGDEIDMEHHVLRPEADNLLMQMARELYDNGSSRCELVDDDDFGLRNDPKDYVPHSECDDTKAAYLKHVWTLMKAAGRFDIRPDVAYYVMAFPHDHSSLHEVFELGFAVSEYQWKIRHEQAALAAYTANMQRTAGLRAATNARKQIGRANRNLILYHSKNFLSWRPKERWTNVQLAECVMDAIAGEAEESGAAPELDLQRQRVRKIIGELRRSGHLPNDAFST